MAAYTLDRLLEISRGKELVFQQQDADECLRPAVLHSNFRAELVRQLGFGMPGSYVVGEATARAPAVRARSLPSRLAVSRWAPPTTATTTVAVASGEWGMSASAELSDVDLDLAVADEDEVAAAAAAAEEDEFQQEMLEQQEELDSTLLLGDVSDSADMTSDSGSEDYETGPNSSAALLIDGLVELSDLQRKRPYADDGDNGSFAMDEGYGSGGRAKRHKAHHESHHHHHFGYLVMELSA